MISRRLDSGITLPELPRALSACAPAPVPGAIIGAVVFDAVSADVLRKTRIDVGGLIDGMRRYSEASAYVQ
jgi:hypothetical protein